MLIHHIQMKLTTKHVCAECTCGCMIVVGKRVKNNVEKVREAIARHQETTEEDRLRQKEILMKQAMAEF